MDFRIKSKKQATKFGLGFEYKKEKAEARNREELRRAHQQTPQYRRKAS